MGGGRVLILDEGSSSSSSSSFSFFERGDLVDDFFVFDD